MPVAGQTPTRVHLIDSESIAWETGAAYTDPNDPTKLVRDVHAHEQELQLYADDTGAANAYVITLSPAPTIVEGTKFVIKAAHANTGASTLAVDGASPIAIVKGVSTPLAGGEISAGQVFEVTFDGTNYQLSATPPTVPGGANHSTQINSSGAFAGVGPGTSGQFLKSAGASADPAFANIAESDVTSLVTDLAGKVPTTRQINTTAPLTGGGDLSADRTLAISAFTGDSGSGGAKGAVPAPAAGDAAAKKYLKADGTWSAIVEGDVTGLVSDLAGKVPTSRQINTTAPLTGGGDLSADRTLAINAATATTPGAVPTPPNDATKYLDGTANWSTPLKNVPVNAQTGISYAFLDSDRGKLVTFSNASAIAAALPQAGASSLFIGAWFCFIENRGAGTLTITPTTSTIDGAASLVLKANQGVALFSDGTNYFTMRGKPGNVDLTADVTGILPLANGGSGSASPSLVAGSNVTISGSWPNQTVAASGPFTGGGTSVYPPLTKPVSTDFTWSNQLTATVTDKSDRMIMIASSGGHGSALFYNSALPSTPYTIDMAFLGHWEPYSGAVIICGLALKSSGGALRSYSVRNNGGGALDYRSLQAWASITSPGAEAATSPTAELANTLIFLRITDNGTTRSFYTSYNGKDYALGYSEATNTGITPTSVGILTYDTNVTLVATNSIYHWLVSTSILPQFAS